MGRAAPGSSRRFRLTRCATRLPRTCWRRGLTSERSRNSSVTRMSRRPWCTRTRLSGADGLSRARWISGVRRHGLSGRGGLPEAAPLWRAGILLRGDVGRAVALTVPCRERGGDRLAGGEPQSITWPFRPSYALSCIQPCRRLLRERQCGALATRGGSNAECWRRRRHAQALRGGPHDRRDRRNVSSRMPRFVPPSLTRYNRRLHLHSCDQTLARGTNPHQPSLERLWLTFRLSSRSPLPG
jgi:hypothetical protein